MTEFARLALLVVVLLFCVQANERAKRIVRERRLYRTLPVNNRPDSVGIEQRVVLLRR